MKNAKLLKITAVSMVTALSLMAFSGCNYRGGNSGTSSAAPNTAASQAVERADQIEDRVESDIGRGVSELERDLAPGADRNSMVEDETEREGSLNDVSRAEVSRIEQEHSAQASVPAMSADFSEIGALDGKKDTGFPGGPVDELNRPSGPLSYQSKYGEYGAHFIVPGSKKIYLTFDEGYENGYTSRILDILKEKNVKAVFFITYPYAKSEPALVKRMVDEGHALGNHSTKHLIFPDMPLEEAAKDLTTLHDYVLANFGYEMWLFRPPEGAFSEQTLALAQQLGYNTMLWSFAYKDYDINDQPSTIEAQGTILKKLHPGEICLLHAVSRTNTEILGSTIDETRAKGFEFADYFYFH